MSGRMVARRGAVAAGGKSNVIPVALQAVSTLGSAALSFNPAITSSNAALTVTNASGVAVLATMLSYNSIGTGGSGGRSVMYDGTQSMTEIANAFIVDSNFYIGWWIVTPTTFGAKNVVGTIGSGGNAGRLLWVGAASYVNVGGTAGGAAQGTSSGVGQVISSSADANEIIVNSMLGNAGLFGAYSQTADLGPAIVPGNTLCGVMGHAAGGASRTFSINQGGYAASARLLAA